MNRNSLTQDIELSTTAQHSLCVLIYYDIFNYPLTEEEIWSNHPQKNITLQMLKDSLLELQQQEYIYLIHSFYSLQNKEHLVSRRLKGNQLAQQQLTTAYRMSKLISYFPFVRGVLLSGSISKNYMEEQSDIDYFIITAPNRLWMARTFLKLYRLLFLGNSSEDFCLNYFIAENQLEIEEQNLFTAIELATLIPTYQAKSYEQLRLANPWTQDYLPNYPQRSISAVIPKNNSWRKKWIEWFLNGRVGNWIDDGLLYLMRGYWRRKFPNFDPEDRKIAFKSTKNVSKQHANYYQKKILTTYQAKVREVLGRN